MSKIRVGVLGETGLVGQHYLRGLNEHPYFKYTQDLGSCQLIFSALPDEIAQEVEPDYAERGYAVFSSVSYHHLESDIPLIIPEVNSDHLNLIRMQQEKRGWKKGFIVAKPNCTLQNYLLLF